MSVCGFLVENRKAEENVGEDRKHGQNECEKGKDR